MISAILKIILAVTLTIIFTVLIPGKANADIQFPLDYAYSGASPDGTAPWLTATITDSGFNTVRLTMSASNLTGSDFISKWYFNLDPVLTGSLTFTAYDTTAVEWVTPSYAVDSYKAGGDGWYDIRFKFPTANGSTDRFNGGDSVIYDISYSGTGTLSASSFLFQSYAGRKSGQYETAVHIQGITGGNSGWIANTTVVPEPISSILFVAGGAVLGFRRYRKIKEFKTIKKK